MPAPVEITETEIPGLLVIKTTRFIDARGFFMETFSQAVWEKAGFSERFVQDNLSESAKGTLRGMHYQLSRCGMGKLVRVVSGAVFDVAVDLRRGSPTFGKWLGQTLTGDNGLAFWVPVGFAHGFVALEDRTYVWYKCTSHHAPEAERALNYADPRVGIEWPLTPTIISKKDAAAPFLDAAEYDFVFADR